MGHHQLIVLCTGLGALFMAPEVFGVVLGDKRTMRVVRTLDRCSRLSRQKFMWWMDGIARIRVFRALAVLAGGAPFEAITILVEDSTILGGPSLRFLQGWALPEDPASWDFVPSN